MPGISISQAFLLFLYIIKNHNINDPTMNIPSQISQHHIDAIRDQMANFGDGQLANGSSDSSIVGLWYNVNFPVDESEFFYSVLLEHFNYLKNFDLTLFDQAVAEYSVQLTVKTVFSDLLQEHILLYPN
jgi:hypothetical protein